MAMTNPEKERATKCVDSVINALVLAPREGGSRDEPEGNRWITVSDTLTLTLIQDLQEARRLIAR